MKKRLFSILTALCLCLTLLPTAALATDDTSSEYDMNKVSEVLELTARSETPPTAAEYNEAYDLDKDGVLTTWDAKLMLDTMPDLTGLALGEGTLTMPVGSKARLNVTYTPSNSYDMRLKWESSDPEVATVEGGVVTALKAGTVTITATAVADPVDPKPTATRTVTVTDTAPTISAKALQINTKGAGTSEWADLEIKNGTLTVTSTTDSFTAALGALCGDNTTRYPNAGALLNGKTLLLQTSYRDNTTGVSGNHIQAQVDPNSFAAPALSKKTSDRWYDATTLSSGLLSGQLLVVAAAAGTSLRNYFVTDGKEMVPVTAPTDFPALLGIAAGKDSSGAEVLYGVTSGGTLYQFTLTSTSNEERPYELSKAKEIGSVPTSEMIQGASLLYDETSEYLLVSVSYATNLVAEENAGLFYLIDPENPNCYFDLTPADGAVFTSLYQHQRIDLGGEAGVYLYVDETPISLTEGSSVKLPEAEAYSFKTENGLVTNNKLSDSEVKWDSADKTIVQVNENGTITGVKKGETYIQAWASSTDDRTTSSNQIKVTVIADTGLAGATVGALVDTSSGTVWADIKLDLDVSGNLTFDEKGKADNDYTAGGYAQGKLWGFCNISSERKLYPFNAETFTASGDPFTTGTNNVRDLTGAPATTVTYTKDGSLQTVTDPASLLYVTSKADLGRLGLLGSNGSINAPYQYNEPLVSDYEGDDTLTLSAITYVGDLTAAQVREGTKKDLSNCDADTPCHVYYALTEDAKLRQLILVPQVDTNGTLSYTLCGSTIATVTGFPSDDDDYTSTTSMDILKMTDKTYLLVARSSRYNGGSSLWKIDITSYTYAEDNTLAATKIGSLDNTTQTVTALYHTGTDVIPYGHILAAAGWGALPQSLSSAMLSASPMVASAEQSASGSEDATTVTVDVTSSEPATNGLWTLEYDNSKLSSPVVTARDDVLYWSYRHYPRKDSETGIVRIAFAIRGTKGLTSSDENPLFTVNFTAVGLDASADDVTVTQGEINPIKVQSGDHGTVTAPDSAMVGSTVELTAAPNKGYVLDTIAVNDDNVKLTDKGNGKYTFAMPGVPVTVEAVFVLSASHIHDFASDWSYDASQHWHACNGCDEKGSPAAHSFQWITDKAATTAETGLKHEECTACHAKRNENTVIDKLPSGGSGSYTPTYPVSAPSKAENGSVSISSKNAAKGTTVTITVKPNSGYTLETIVVTDKNGNELKLTDKGNGQYTFTMPDGNVEVKATFMEDNSVLNFFYDVPNDAYYYEAVKWAAEKGITSGIGNDLFAPNQPCNRAQIVTFLWRVAGSPVVNYTMNMTDVAEDAYYAEAVRWALSEGVTTGTSDGKFSPDAACTRAQAVAFLFRAAVANGLEAVTLADLLSGFEDAASVPAYAVPAMNWALSQGIVKGSGAQLLPGDTCTRAQIVTFLWRAFSK